MRILLTTLTLFLIAGTMRLRCARGQSRRRYLEANTRHWSTTMNLAQCVSMAGITMMALASQALFGVGHATAVPRRSSCSSLLGSPRLRPRPTSPRKAPSLPTFRREIRLQAQHPMGYRGNIGPDLGCYPGSPWAKLVRTPNLDRFAHEGMRYELAFSTAPIRSPGRLAFMTGMHQTSIGAHNHRSHRHDHFQLPAGVRPLTHRLAEAGYFTANIRTLASRPVGTGKTDLNFELAGPVLNLKLAATRKPRANDDGIDAKGQNDRNEVRLYHATEWADLKTCQPFFAQVNLPVVDRGGTRGWVGSRSDPWQGRPAIRN